MAFRYRLYLENGEDIGEFATAAPDWHVGDEFRAAGNRRLRMTAVVPTERIAEFIDGPVRAIWEVIDVTARG